MKKSQEARPSALGTFARLLTLAPTDLLLRKIACLLALSVTSASLAQSTEVIEPQVLQELQQSADGRAYVLVVLRESSPILSTQLPTDRRSQVRELQRTVLDSISREDFEPIYRYKNFPVLTAWVNAAAIERIRVHPSVRKVGVDGQGEPRLAQSRPFLGADRVEDMLGINGTGATVAVIDNGIEASHPDLAGSVLPGVHFLGNGNNGPGAEPNTDGCGPDHGTLVSGVITSDGLVAPRGIAPGAEVLMVKMDFRDSNVIAAADYITSVKDEHPSLVAINYSGGRYFDDITLPEPCPCDEVNAAAMASQLAFQAAKDAGIVSFAASGNEGSCGPTGQMGYPPCVSAVVGVGAVHDADLGREPDEGTWCDGCNSECCDSNRCPDCFSETTTPGQPACWMDRTACTELIAPGHLVVTSGGNGGASEARGTSFSSPHAAAVAALLSGRCLSPDEIVDVMKRSGTVVSDGCPVDDQPTVVLNALAAVELAEAEFPLCDDCNHNLVPDEEEIASGSSADCDGNGVPDVCDPDCDKNGVADACDIANGLHLDCNGNGIPDACDLRPTQFRLGEAQEVRLEARGDLTQIADVDQDGAPDLVVVGRESQQRFVKVLLNNGEGGFRQTREAPLSARSSMDMTVGDVDGNGLDDAVVIEAPGDVILFRNLPSNPGFEDGTGIPLDSPATEVIAVSLDGNHLMDLVVLHGDASSVSVLLSQADGTFASSLYPVGEGPLDLQAADFEGDGDLDLAVATVAGIEFLRNEGGGVLVEGQTISMEERAEMFLLEDWNRDGMIDIASAAIGSDTVHVHLHHARRVAVHLGRDWGLSEYEIWEGPIFGDVRQLVAGDVEHDGHVDILVLSATLGGVTYLPNQGDGTFGLGKFLVTIPPRRTFDAGDLDGDGLLDVTALTNTTRELRVFPNASVPPRSPDCNGNGTPDECDIASGELSDKNTDGVPDICQPRFVRGDCNDNGQVDISDGRCILDWRFSGAAEPGCIAATNTNGDEGTNIADAIYLFGSLFLGGPPPVPPFPECGLGTDNDATLGCAAPPGSCQ